MDKDDNVDVDMPTVDGIPIPPYEPLSYPNPGPITEEQWAHSQNCLAKWLLILFVLGFVLFVVVTLTGGARVWLCAIFGCL